ncbi:methyltransferase domain-containing protein [Patescibacteria group bacterium]|nr:MAG: methyltransferase domain-containing protein [Patescibacteria group bacterium]
MSLFSFLKSLIRDPRTVGTLSPASPFTARRVADAIPAGTKSVLELGAGDGALTRELLKRLPSDGRVYAVEVKPEFARALEAIGDPRLVVFEGDALDVRADAARHGVTSFDAVVSSLPFALFAEGARDRIIADVHAMLGSGGTFIVCQHLPTLLPALKKHFSVDTSFEPLNLPPYFIIKATHQD